jgi:hypothetical protein
MTLTTDGQKSIIITVVLSVIATLFVAARVWMRAKKGFVGSDDWLLIVGVFLLYLQDVGAILRKSRAITRKARNLNLLCSCHQGWGGKASSRADDGRDDMAVQGIQHASKAWKEN